MKKLVDKQDLSQTSLQVNPPLILFIIINIIYKLTEPGQIDLASTIEWSTLVFLIFSITTHNSTHAT